ncbi:hypothetical protein HPP92_028693 [Vanilla planifolia]|uniref:Uncharacterized protein n=1 Tax=Vanilla planifolia TaxID=51239 RepID=A0A835U5E9_VANPL|nr:hypothetical protein HPP92_028693 [Vanilla planifolia]KAG0446771.1 hypothetical protein HPP92_028679 [Vanilla planifolia]
MGMMANYTSTYYPLFPTLNHHHFPTGVARHNTLQHLVLYDQHALSMRQVWIHNVGIGSLVYSAETICDRRRPTHCSCLGTASRIISSTMANLQKLVWHCYRLKRRDANDVDLV